MQEALPALTIFSAAVAFRGEVNVQFRARAARAGVAHHPEVVFAVAGDNVVGGQVFQPHFFGFGIGGHFFVAAEVGGVETLFREAPDSGDEFPRPVDGFFFEVVAERPVAEHFEEGVVVGVETDIVEVVMLAAGADAFLGVGGAARGVGAVGLAEKDRHELVHTGVGEQQVGRVRQQASGFDDGVLFRFEEIEEGLTDLIRGHVLILSSGFRVLG